MERNWYCCRPHVEGSLYQLAGSQLLAGESGQGTIDASLRYTHQDERHPSELLLRRARREHRRKHVCQLSVFFDGSAPIHIGKNCGIGMEVLFCTSTHLPGPPTERAGPVHPQPITVGDGCWIGARAVILPGVTIGEGCVIAAGAVVHRDCAPNSLYAGVPARRIKELPVQQ